MYGIGLIVLFGFKNYKYNRIFTNLYVHIPYLNNKFSKIKTTTNKKIGD